MRRRGRSRAARGDTELNITAYMNLMVVLVPFLLVMAVFSRISILELNFPSGDQAQSQKQEKQQQDLEVIVYKNFISVGTRQGGEIRRFPNKKDDYDLAGVSELLVQIKQKLPKKEEVTLLMDSEVKYDSLVKVMDTVRVLKRLNTQGELEVYYLFPQISIGDAPRQKSAAGTGAKGVAG